jgi:hypothetical protein
MLQRTMILFKETDQVVDRKLKLALEWEMLQGCYEILPVSYY